MKTQIILSVFTAFGASLCCISPVLAIAAGAGSFTASFHWIEPYRPYFISASVLVLGVAWFQSLRVRKDVNCNCDTPNKVSFLQSKTFLSAITITSFLLITFPSYSKFLFPNTPAPTDQDQSVTKKIELPVSGMTCPACELHIEGEVKKLAGVSFVKASYEKKSATVEFDETKINSDKIIAVINGTGYKVEQLTGAIAQKDQNGNCCTNGTCKNHLALLPNEENKKVTTISNVNEIKKVFNQQNGRNKFVAVLSSTCGWCLQGAGSIQKTVVKKMKDKNISLIIVWTNMLKTDDQLNARKAASLFKDENIIQFFDAENKFGDVIAKRLSPKGEKAWDIYMFFDKDTSWNQDFPRPFDYAHQLSPFYHNWVDNTKYFCGDDLTKRLTEITGTL